MTKKELDTNETTVLFQDEIRQRGGPFDASYAVLHGGNNPNNEIYYVHRDWEDENAFIARVRGRKKNKKKEK